ncbi:MAG: Rieske (2Fe-2S) iron-sulfur protein [Firmicutes bacterium]|nr:Rieske (2Fe-2S) iron-sulfur protein [Bacillota bacterium]
MLLLLKRVIPISLLIVLMVGCSATRPEGQLAIPLAKITPPESVTTVRLVDYAVDSPFTKVVHVVRLPDGQFLALSAKDPNGGCTVPWNAQAHLFWNPCHGAQYNIRGEVLTGPAIRGLDRFPVHASVADRKVYVDVANPPAPGAAR